jgi:AraC family transcriptional regulator
MRDDAPRRRGNYFRANSRSVDRGFDTGKTHVLDPLTRGFCPRAAVTRSHSDLSAENISKIEPAAPPSIRQSTAQVTLESITSLTVEKPLRLPPQCEAGFPRRVAVVIGVELGLTEGKERSRPGQPGLLMTTKPIFTIEDTHGVIQRFDANIGASSEGMGWSSAFASMQRERPFEGRFQALSDCLMVLHRGGPVDVTFRTEGRTIARYIPKGGIFFLPAAHECDVVLHSSLDTIHIYLRADLFTNPETESSVRASVLAPIFGECDAVLGHLGGAIGEVIRDNLSRSSLFADQIAKAIANRFIAFNCRDAISDRMPRSGRLTSRQVRRIRDFVETELDTDIRLNKMAATCGLSTEYFVRLFKATFGVPPYQYVLGRRVERAKTLLDENKEGLADIALQCGFSHQEHMTRMFRRFTGVTPGRYRRGSD